MSDKQKLAQVFHFDLYGKREEKYDFLNENSIETIDWNILETTEPNFFFVNKNFEGKEEYEKGFKVDKLMTNLNPGVESGRDDFFIDFDIDNLSNKIKNVFLNKDNAELIKLYGINDTTSFRFASNLQMSKYQKENIKKISYRPFDFRFTYYDVNLQRRPSFDTFNHIINGSLGLVIKRGFDEIKSAPVFIVNTISDRRGWTRSGMQGAESIAPLYLYPETNAQQTIDETVERKPNLNEAIVQQIAEKIGLTFVSEKTYNSTLNTHNSFAPIDILDYIYAVLHSPTYREKYKEFLKIDFPRVPFPKDLPSFQNLVSLGAELRQIHLLENNVVNKPITKYPIGGDNVVEKIKFHVADVVDVVEVVHLDDVKTGTVYINATQYFDNVPEIAWNFYIGGYQPAQKWLKDRKGRTLEFDDILHYQKIIVALSETNRIMQEIDKIEME